MALAARRGDDSPLRGAFLQESGRIALCRKEWTKAETLLTDAISLLESGGDPFRGDVAAAHYNLAHAQIALEDFASAVRAAQTAHDIDASIYGPSHPELIIDELRLAEALVAASNLEAGRVAISRCLAIIRTGTPQGRSRRADALIVAIGIDLSLGLPPSE